MKDKRLNEQIIVTGSGSGIVPVDADPVEGIEQVLQAIASGNLTEDEVAQQRTNVQNAIRSSKKMVWDEHGSLESRRKAI